MYFKREFDKKHGNCGVLARFVLFLSGIKHKPVVEPAFHPFLFVDALFPGHRAANVFFVDIIFCYSDVIHFNESAILRVADFTNF